MLKLCVIPGDGIGKEVIPVAVRVLQAAVPHLTIVEADAGWETFVRTGTAVPAETLQAIRECGAGLFGAVSSPSYKVDGYRSAILTMRQELNLYANIRPVVSWPHISPKAGLDMIIVRENSEGLYSGRERMEDSGDTAIAERVITRAASRRIAEKTRTLMQNQNRRTLTIVHKANVLPVTDGLFRDTVRECFTANEFIIDELLVDVAALKMLSDPERFDVVVTTNLFGDILSDAAAHWSGGLGFAPSLNWGDGIALAEPVHGSAPDIAGMGLANPIAAVLSGAMLARYAWGLNEVADRIETAVFRALARWPHWNMGQSGLTDIIASAILEELS